MSRGKRIGALAVAAIIAIAAVLLLRPGGRESSPTSQRSAAEPAQPGQKSTGTETASQPEPKPKPAYTVVRIRDGEPVGGVEEVSVTKGEQVRLEFRSDQEGEIHIHGYDKYVDTKPGKPARVRFKADLEGIYEIEDHGTASPLAELRVNPS